MTNRGEICARLQVTNKKSHTARERLWRNIPHRGYSFQTRTFYPARITARRKNAVHIRRVGVHLTSASHARMESVLVIVGWENMAREISDSGFMRASSRGERRISILTFLRARGEAGVGGLLHATTTEFL